MRAERLVTTLLLLQRHGRVTAGQLAEHTGVSVPTARRDLESLSSAGVPVYAQPGRGGGWELVGGARNNPRPSRFGMFKSERIRCRRDLDSISSAWNPSSASATFSIPICCKQDRTRARTALWSSTTSTSRSWAAGITSPHAGDLALSSLRPTSASYRRAAETGRKSRPQD